MRPQHKINILRIPLHNFVHIGQIRHRLAPLVNNKTRTPLIRKVLDTLRRHYLHKFDMPVLLSHLRQVHVDQPTELVAVLVEMQQHEIVGIGLGHLPDVLVPGDFYHLPVLHLFDLHLQLLHTLGHVLLRELILKI